LFTGWLFDQSLSTATPPPPRWWSRLSGPRLFIANAERTVTWVAICFCLCVCLRVCFNALMLFVYLGRLFVDFYSLCRITLNACTFCIHSVLARLLCQAVLFFWLFLFPFFHLRMPLYEGWARANWREGSGPGSAGWSIGWCPGILGCNGEREGIPIKQQAIRSHRRLASHRPRVISQIDDAQVGGIRQRRNY